MLELFKDFKIRSQKGIGILLVIPPPLYILSDYYETCYFLDIACPPPKKKPRHFRSFSDEFKNKQIYPNPLKAY